MDVDHEFQFQAAYLTDFITDLPGICRSDCIAQADFFYPHLVYLFCKFCQFTVLRPALKRTAKRCGNIYTYLQVRVCIHDICQLPERLLSRPVGIRFIVTLAQRDHIRNMADSCLICRFRPLEIRHKRQQDAWIISQRGHAVANGLPVIAVNRVGHEPDPSQQTRGIQFWGHSFVCGPQGEIVAAAPSDSEWCQVVEVDLGRSENVRRWWPFLRDRRIDAYDDILRRFID